MRAMRWLCRDEIMRRYWAFFLFFVVLIVPFVLRRSAGEPEEITADERLVVITPNAIEIRREFADAFSAWHKRHYGTTVLLDYRALGGTEDIRRFLQASYAIPGALQQGIGIDVAWSGGNTLFDEELPANFFVPLNLPAAELKAVFPSAELGGVKLYTDRWAGVCLSSFGIIYNSDVCDELDVSAPRTWADMTDPRLAGMVALADPTHAGSAGVAYIMVIQRAMADAGPDAGFKRGMGTLLLMAANARYFSDSSPLPVNDVAAGEAAEGVSIDYYAQVTADMVGPRRMQYVLPANATAITPDPVAILAGTSGHRLELANHFVEFLLSVDGQRIWALKAGVPGGPREEALHRLPIRRDLYNGDRSDWADQQDNPFAAANGFNMRNEWMSIFGDIRPIWAAAWIDDGDELHAAYARILAVKDDARRAALLQELSDLPVSLADVKGDGRARKAASDPQLWAAHRRIEWAQLFRAHYAAVAAKAGNP
jgi:iron(III) transport system substrate-binding protein